MNYNKSLFQGVPKKNPNVTTFNLSHEWKSQISLGKLVPCLLLEAMPGDDFIINSEFMSRAQSLFYPIMHKLTMRCDYYYIPNRILWTYQGTGNQGWAKWISEMTEETLPYIDADMEESGAEINQRVLSYMGVPLSSHATNHIVSGISAFPLSAYLKIYDEYYRVPQLEDELWFPLVDGDNTATFNTQMGANWKCLPSLWEKDYFTSALPTPQIGEAVRIPLVNEDPTIDADATGGEFTYPSRWVKADGTTPATPGQSLTTGADSLTVIGSDTGSGLNIQETAATIKQLRVAEILQSYYERIMKIGQRYRDFIEGMFGHDPMPMSVDVPVQFGSKFGRIQISDTLTTAETVNGTVTSVTGDYRGNANLYSADNDNMRCTCLEHGWIMAIIQVNPNTGYGNGLHRMWKRKVQTDFPLDMFSTIGDQEILKEEVVYHFSNNAKNEETFGYIPRHSEMRYQNNIFTNTLLFNNNISQHLGRLWNWQTLNYDDLEINKAFVHTDQPITQGGIRTANVFRVLPISGAGDAAQHTLFLHIFHSIYVKRNLPLYATPKL